MCSPRYRQAIFNERVTRIFGKDNPERMSVPFWEAMVRCGGIGL